jgi:hypothetical protein
MATIPSGTKFLGVDPALTNLTEKKGSRLDSKTEYFSIDDMSNALRPYKIYRALVTQSGEGAPTAIVLENTFGQVPNYFYQNNGVYTLEFPTATLTINKTIPSQEDGFFTFNRLINSSSDTSVGRGYGIQRSNENVITIYTFSDAESRADDILNKSLIEVIVYN